MALSKPQKLNMEMLGHPPIKTQYPNGDVLVAIGGIDYVLATNGNIYYPEEYEDKLKGIKPKEEPKPPKGPKEPKPPKTTYYYGKTVCMTTPECCQPRDIRHVAWDADNTMWDILPHGIASSITGRLEKIDEDTVVAYPEPYKPVKIKDKEPKPPRVDLWGYGMYGTPSYGKYKPPSTQPEEFEEREWWKTELEEEEEGGEELKDIATELVTSLSPTEQALLTGIKTVTGEEVEIKQLPPGRKEGWYELPPGKPPETRKTRKEEPRYTIKLLPTFRDTLKKLEDQGITSSVISLNTPGSVHRLLEAFGIANRFTEIRDSWENKGKVFAEQARKLKICPCNMIFVDDTLSHVTDVSNKCGLGLQIGKNKDVELPIQILDFIKK